MKSTICATNLLIGCVLAVLLAAAMVIVGPEKVMQSLEMPGFMDIAGNAASYVIAAMVVMTNTAAVSLALEGKNIWLIKSLPIPPKTLYDSYLLSNLTFTVPTSLICSLLFSISLKNRVCWNSADVPDTVKLFNVHCNSRYFYREPNGLL